VLEGGVRGQNGVVGLDDGARQLRCRVYAKLQLGLLAVICGQTLKKESAKTRSSSATKRVEHEEALQTRAVISQATELVHHRINKLFSNGVVTTSIYDTIQCEI
jgi:hypothetical protein